jgi:hypothetical protein
MPTDIEGWQKYHVRITPYQSDRRLQNREQVEDQKGEYGGVFEVSVKIDLND